MFVLFTMRSCSLAGAQVDDSASKRDTLLSSFRLFQTVSVNASISPSVRLTRSGSPSKEGSGLPSPRVGVDEVALSGNRLVIFVEEALQQNPRLPSRRVFRMDSS